MHCSCLAGCCTSTLVLLLPVLRKYLKGPHLLQCLSCRVLHKYPAFVAPGAAQVPTGASFFAVFHASVSTGETEAKTEATIEARTEAIFVVVVASPSRLLSGCSLRGQLMFFRGQLSSAWSAHHFLKRCINATHGFFTALYCCRSHSNHSGGNLLNKHYMRMKKKK